MSFLFFTPLLRCQNMCISTTAPLTVAEVLLLVQKVIQHNDTLTCLWIKRCRNMSGKELALNIITGVTASLNYAFQCKYELRNLRCFTSL